MQLKRSIRGITLASLRTREDSHNSLRTLRSTVNQKFIFKFFRSRNLQFVSTAFSLPKVLPTIVPFTFGEEQINLDDSIMASCSIIKGDSPIKIWWRFDDEHESYNLTTNDGVVITRASQKISILAIDAVKGRHRGNYTCIASNKGGVSQHSAYLDIHGSIMKIFLFNQLARILQFA